MTVIGCDKRHRHAGLIRLRNNAWSVFAEAYDADARDFGVSTPHFSLAAYFHWNIHFDDPMRVTASLLLEPACNAMQESAGASELIELGYPVSSPSEVELVGDLDSASASLHGFHRIGKKIKPIWSKMAPNWMLDPMGNHPRQFHLRGALQGALSGG